MKIQYQVQLLGGQTEPTIYEGTDKEEAWKALDELQEHTLHSGAWIIAWDLDDVDEYGVPELIGQMSGEEYMYNPDSILYINRG